MSAKRKAATAKQQPTAASKSIKTTEIKQTASSMTAPRKLLKVMTWNVTSLKSTALKKKTGAAESLLIDCLRRHQPDIVAVQETKLNTNNLEEDKDLKAIDAALESMYPYRYYHCCQSKRGYAGSAVWSRMKPLSIHLGFLPDAEFADDEGRLITLEFTGLNLVATYVPNASQGLKRLNWKTKRWNQALLKHFQALESKSAADKKPILWVGDMNVCRHDQDLSRPNENRNKTAGFTDQERESFEMIIDHLNAVDVWRELHGKDTQQFTYFSRRFNCRQKGIGWRLDYVVASKSLASSITKCEILDDEYGPSDHIPVQVEIIKGESDKIV